MCIIATVHFILVNGFCNIHVVTGKVTAFLVLPNAVTGKVTTFLVLTNAVTGKVTGFLVLTFAVTEKVTAFLVLTKYLLVYSDRKGDSFPGANKCIDRKGDSFPGAN